jgi:FkbM family methyltransferase
MTLAALRRTAGVVKRQLFPDPAMAAWRQACAAAAMTPRFAPGAIALGPYRLRYPDLLTLCPQWKDIFIQRSLAFRSSRSDPRILDCGANIGLATLFFKAEYPAARITAFEADPAIAALLGDNLRANGAGDVAIVPAAVWTAAGTLAFHADGADGGTIVSGVPERTSRLIEVAAIRLRDVIAAEPIDLLKLDIEGAETPVLEDCAGQLPNVAAMLVEVHEFDPGDRRGARIFSLLEAAGFNYVVTHITPTPGRPAVPDTPFPHRSSSYVMAVSAWRRGAA